MEKAPREPFGNDLMFTRLGLANRDAVILHFLQFGSDDLRFRFQQSFDEPNKELALSSFVTGLLFGARNDPTIGWFGAQDSSGELVVVIACELLDPETMAPSMSIVPRLRRTGAHEAAWSWMLAFARRIGIRFIDGSFLASNNVVRKGLEKFGIAYTIAGDVGHYRLELKSEAEFVKNVLDQLSLLFVANDDMQARLSLPAKPRL